MTILIKTIDQISSFGKNLEEYFKATVDYRYRKEECNLPISEDYDDLIAGDFGNVSNIKESRQMDGISKTTLACALNLLKRSKDEDGCIQNDAYVNSCIIGSAYGCIQSNHDFLERLLLKGGKGVPPVVFRNTVSNAVVGRLAINTAFKGINTMFNSGALSGIQSIICGYDLLSKNKCENVLCGASDILSDEFQYAILNSEQCLPEIEMKQGLINGSALLLLNKSEKESLSEIVFGSFGRVRNGSIYKTIINRLQDIYKRYNISETDIDLIAVSSDENHLISKENNCGSIFDELKKKDNALMNNNFFDNTSLVPMLSLFELLVMGDKEKNYHFFPELSEIKNKKDTYKLFIALDFQNSFAMLLIK